MSRLLRQSGNGWALGATVVAGLVYARTAAPGLSWANDSGDGGELIAAAVTLGIPHPPGYPLYVLLGKLLSLFPGGDIAYRFNLWSAACMAAASGVVTLICWDRLGRSGAHPWAIRGVTALSAGLSLAFASLVWGQATVSEVYGLNLLFLAAFLWSLLGPGRPGLTGLLLGLSVTTHLTSWLMLPLALALTPARQWKRMGAGVLAGLTPFLVLFLLARGDSPILWGDATTLSGWWWLVSGVIYRSNVFSLARPAVWARCLEWFPLLLNQFTPAAPLILVAGFFGSGRSERGWRLVLLATAMLYLLYALLYDSTDSIVYLLPGLMLVSVVLSTGLIRVGWMAIGLPLLLLLLNFSAKDLSGEALVQPRAEQLLADVPANAVLLTPGDATIFALWYGQHVEQLRPDLILVDQNLFAFEWYRAQLARRYHTLPALEEDDLPFFEQRNLRERAVCSVAIVPAQGDTTVEYSCFEAMH